MKIGDLVKMKPESLWSRKTNYNRVPYIKSPLIILEKNQSFITVLFPDGSIQSDAIRNYTLIHKRNNE